MKWRIPERTKMQDNFSQHPTRRRSPGCMGRNMIFAIILLSNASPCFGQRGDLCACTPTIYEWTLDFNANCTDITLGPTGFEGIGCQIEAFESNVTDLKPVEAVIIDITEFDQNNQAMQQTLVDGSFQDGDIFAYISASSNPKNITEETIPKFLQITIVALNRRGEPLNMVWVTSFTNSCNETPVFTEGDQMAWTIFSNLADPSPELCPESSGPTPSITLAPTGTPTQSPAFKSPTEAPRATPSPTKAKPSPELPTPTPTKAKPSPEQPTPTPTKAKPPSTEQPTPSPSRSKTTSPEQPTPSPTRSKTTNPVQATPSPTKATPTSPEKPTPSPTRAKPTSPDQPSARPTKYCPPTNQGKGKGLAPFHSSKKESRSGGKRPTTLKFLKSSKSKSPKESKYINSRSESLAKGKGGSIFRHPTTAPSTEDCTPGPVLFTQNSQVAPSAESWEVRRYPRTFPPQAFPRSAAPAADHKTPSPSPSPSVLPPFGRPKTVAPTLKSGSPPQTTGIGSQGNTSGSTSDSGNHQQNSGTGSNGNESDSSGDSNESSGNNGDDNVNVGNSESNGITSGVQAEDKPKMSSKEKMILGILGAVAVVVSVGIAVLAIQEYRDRKKRPRQPVVIPECSLPGNNNDEGYGIANPYQPLQQQELEDSVSLLERLAAPTSHVSNVSSSSKRDTGVDLGNGESRSHLDSDSDFNRHEGLSKSFQPKYSADPWNGGDSRGHQECDSDFGSHRGLSQSLPLKRSGGVNIATEEDDIFSHVSYESSVGLGFLVQHSPLSSNHQRRSRGYSQRGSL